MKATDLAQLAQNAESASDFLKAMANPNRLMILCTLLDGELSVNDLNDRIPLSQSALSQHLSSLRKADLVETRREATTIFYQLKGESAIQIIEVLKNLFCPKDS